MMNNTNKILPVNHIPHVTVYKNYSFPLCIMNADSSTVGWMFNHFTNFYITRDENDYIWFDFLEPDNFYSDYLIYNHIDIDNIQKYDIIDLIKSTINNSEYVTLFMDEHYLTKGKESALTEFFLYGFNDETETIYSVGFDEKNYFRKLEYSYEDIRKAYGSFINNLDSFGKLPVWMKWYTFTQITRKNDYKPIINVKNIVSEIKKYANSDKQTEKLRAEVVEERGNTAIFGFDCHKEILKSLYALLDGKFQTDFRHIHLLYEHKKMMLNKMEYIYNQLNIDASSLCSRYNDIIKKYEKARLVYLKPFILNKTNKIYGQLKDHNTINNIIKTVEETMNEEKAILNDFLSNVDSKLFLLE